MVCTMPLDAGGTFLTRQCVAVTWFPDELTDVATYCIQHNRVSELGKTEKNTVAQQHGTKDVLTELRERSEMDAAFEKTLDLIEGSPATGKSVAGIVNLFVDNFLEQVKTKWNKLSSRDSEKIPKLVPKTGTMLLSQDKEFVGHAILQLDGTLKLAKKKPLRSWRRSQWNETRVKTPMHPCDACNVQKPSGTDKLVAGQDTVSMLLQVLQMCFNGSFSNN